MYALRLLATLLVALAPALASDTFRFVVLGDRTGEAQPGIYEQVWKEATAEGPAFVVSVGDTIEGLNDITAETEWEAVEQILAPYRRYALYLAPGNHDVWSERSERAFRKHARHAPHYGFDYEQAHFTVLDNSRSEQFSPDELNFLEKDLQAHVAQPVKFIVSHRPSWLMDIMFANPNFAVHRLAKKYSVQYVIAGHVHEMLHVGLDGVTYLSIASAGRTPPGVQEIRGRLVFRIRAGGSEWERREVSDQGTQATARHGPRDESGGLGESRIGRPARVAGATGFRGQAGI